MKLPSIFSILKVGIGPSSSHTLGALKIAQDVRKYLLQTNMLIEKINVQLLGSFAYTGAGHLTDKAVVAGLNGFKIKDDESITDVYNIVKDRKKIRFNNKEVIFDTNENIKWITKNENLNHPNTVIFEIIKQNNKKEKLTYFSIGGGDIRKKEDYEKKHNHLEKEYDFSDIINFVNKKEMNFIDFIKQNEKKYYNIAEDEFYEKLNKIWNLMQTNIENGLKNEGKLPGKLGVERRAKKMYSSFLENLRNWRLLSRQITLANIYAISVSEENASGAKIITAPTCGSCGILPSALKVMQEKYHLKDKKILEALIISGIIGAVIKKNGSISGAEVGCQGEVGVAASMAAAAICYLLKGNIKQIEGAAEIALEHHLGLTCDPIGGLVQIPCIERNGVGVITALNAANMSIMRKTPQKISLDYAIDAMMEIGNDMHKKYKETSLGGLAGRFKSDD